jgi:thiamine transport system ATP-binding protein
MLAAREIVVSFDGKRAVDGATIEVATGETLALLGPSGSGKSTLLRVIAGLQPVDEGHVLVDGVDLAGVPPYRRGIGFMFQDGALFPHRDVEANVGFGLKVTGRGKAETRRRAHELLELVSLGGYERRAIDTLSGGERQRVALARALAPAPRVLLLDEPLASLDGPLRDRLRDDLADLFERLDLAVVYVTHDVGEALSLGHRVAVLRSGRDVQTSTPDGLWREPADEWVARFLGMGNIVTRDGRRELIRPEAITVRPDAEGNATVLAVERRGPTTVLRIRLDGVGELESVTLALQPPRAGERISVRIDPRGVVEFRS